MHDEEDRSSTFWLRLALLVITRSMSAPAMVLGERMPPGWMERAASLRWCTVWQNHPDALKRLCAVVLPEP
jgi:hypothetical protein